MNGKYFGEYFDKTENVWKVISCPDYKKLKEIYATKWGKIKLQSRPIKGKHYPVHVRENSNRFCFNREQAPKASDLSSNMTITHELIVDTIARLDNLNIVMGSDNIKIKPNNFFLGKRIETYCQEKKEFIKYYPDIIVCFDDNADYVKKWGGYFAIEVNHTHSPSDTKRKHFQYIGIPLLELDVSSKIEFLYENNPNIGENEFDKYRNFLREIFENKIFLKQKYKTYSNKYLGNIVDAQRKNIEEKNKETIILENTIKKISSEKRILSDHEIKLNQNLYRLTSEISTLTSEKQKMESRLNDLYKMSLTDRLLFLLKLKK